MLSLLGDSQSRVLKPFHACVYDPHGSNLTENLSPFYRKVIIILQKSL